MTRQRAAISPAVGLVILTCTVLSASTATRRATDAKLQQPQIEMSTPRPGIAFGVSMRRPF